MATLTAGCTQVAERFGGGETTPPPTLAVPEGQEPLQQFYEQQLDWVNCGPGECAELEVPVSYDEPDGATIELSLLKVPASSSRNRIGSLVVNPGGPGGSGVDYAAAADFIVGQPVRQRYDIVGFDPRGVARSAPIDCVSDEELDAYMGFTDFGEGTPQDDREESAVEFRAGCDVNAGQLLGHVSTVDAAKDMDILRAALGDEKLTFLGKSYGTYLGAVYAELFTDRVGRFVLDGALPPDLTSEEITIGQAAGFERATRAWAQDCVDNTCPLGGDVDTVMAELAELIASLDADPATVRADARVSELTSNGAIWGVIMPMYEQGMWSMLTDALRDVVDNGDGTALLTLGNQYAQRTSTGSYTGNLIESNTAINCIDREPIENIDAVREQALEAAPLWGGIMASLDGGTCNDWPREIVGGVRSIEAAGADPIVVIGTTRDPATPYEWSTRLAEQLQSGVMVSFDGDGHTAYTRSNDCVDNAINDFYVDGTVPADGLEC